MNAMTSKQAHAYLERWKAVRDMETAELRRTSMETKLRQLAALMASREMFGSDPQREQENQLALDRWASSRKALGA